VTGARAALGAGLLLVVAAGCPVVENRNPYMPPPTGTGSGGSSVPSGDVSVVIDTPVADPIQSYGRGSLVQVQARVTIQNGTDVVDGSSVRLRLTKQGATQVIETGQLVLASTADTYEGRLNLGNLEGGTYTLTVTAASSAGSMGRASVDFQVDAGPLLVVNSPVEGKSYKRTLTVEIVASDPFGLDGMSPTATIGDIPVTLAPVPGMDGVFRGTIDFDAQDPPLFGDQLLTAEATNVNGKRTEVQVIFTIDNDGPVISNTRPAPGDMTGGIVAISAQVTDNAGVLDSSVIAVIADETGTPKFELQLKPAGIGIYTALFDTNRLTECKEPPSTEACIVFPTISFRASDEVGNETVTAYAFFVDNLAPLADLDPPNVRDMKLDVELRCSWSFDPLGVDTGPGDMPNDNTYAPQVFDLRARIQDRGNNRAGGLKIPPISLVDPDRTAVYILDDVTLPLIVDTDGNGTCDSINPELIPTTEPPTMNNQVLKVRLAPVPPAGFADFTPDLSVPSMSTSGWPCVRGLDPQPPLPICSFRQPTIAIGYTGLVPPLPAIWAVEPINDVRCHGNQFDTLANNIGPGWACIAVGTSDHTGNFSVSAPLRVYIDQNPNYSRPFTEVPPGPPPACTGIWNRATNMTTPGACTTLKYPSGQYCYRGSC
jgi:hypothetical protein